MVFSTSIGSLDVPEDGFADAWMSHLRDENDQLQKMRGMFVTIDLKYPARGAVMAPLLKKPFFVRERVALDEILKLEEVRRAPQTAYHSGGRIKAPARVRSISPRASLECMNGSTQFQVVVFLPRSHSFRTHYKRAAFYF
jgi:hypothetical protein